MFKPELQKILDLKKQAAEILMKVKNTATPYDALIDIFEPKMSSEAVATIFDQLRRDLIPIIDKCLASRKQPNISILRKKVPIEIQSEISNSITRFIGYDVESKNAGGRIDETEHPFTTGYYDDVRITTHYHKENVTASLFSVLHEGGHAIYEQNLRQDWMYQPIGASCSYGFHESQSRFVENMIGRSPEFWGHYFPKFKSVTKGAFSSVRGADFMRAINHVKPSKIRIQADEVTYALHIIIRFEMERDLFSGKIAVDELPEIWNEKYKSYLGVKIENDSEGVMQDTHWASGLFGYFPSYALGNIYGGQILTAMEKDVPNWRRYLAKGDFNSIKKWLVKNVYAYGNLYDPENLLRKITGQKINVKNYISYLEDKFSKLYGY
jgi:carboxypeptidase Taq